MPGWSDSMASWSVIPWLPPYPLNIYSKNLFFMRRDEIAADGISIPASYSAFLVPISSSKLHARVRECTKRETPYVVMPHAANLLGSVQEAWSFEHPRTDLVFGHDTGPHSFYWSQFGRNDWWYWHCIWWTGMPITNFHNARSAHLTFQIQSTAACDGFGGYFRAVLYADVIIETLPDSEMSKEMLSWFPMFFPFKVSFIRGD